MLNSPPPMLHCSISQHTVTKMEAAEDEDAIEGTEDADEEDAVAAGDNINRPTRANQILIPLVPTATRADKMPHTTVKHAPNPPQATSP